MILHISNDNYIVYEIENLKEAKKYGKYSSWCIAKRKAFYSDTKDRIDYGGKTLVIQSKTERNSVPEYIDQCEYYCITTLPDKQIDEMVNANNESQLYTDKEDELFNLIKEYL